MTAKKLILILTLAIPALMTGTPGFAREAAPCIGCSNEDCGSGGSACSCWSDVGNMCTRKGVTFHNQTCVANTDEG